MLRQKASSQIHRVSGWLAKLNPAIADAECVLDQVECRCGNRCVGWSGGRALGCAVSPWGLVYYMCCLV